METQVSYKSFNQDKTIEELKYNLLQKRTILRNVITDYRFYAFLLDKPVYKPQITNLFERLEEFKRRIEKIDRRNKILLNEIGMQLYQIDKKMNREDLAYDHFSMRKIDELEYEIAVFLTDASSLKSQIFQYLEHTIVEG